MVALQVFVQLTDVEVAGPIAGVIVTVADFVALET